MWINSTLLNASRVWLYWKLKLYFWVTVTLTSASHVKTIIKKIGKNNIIHQFTPIDHPLSSRIFLNRGEWAFEGEYSHKINDPSFTNNYIYKNDTDVYM